MRAEKSATVGSFPVTRRAVLKAKVHHSAVEIVRRCEISHMLSHYMVGRLSYVIIWYHILSYVIMYYHMI